VSTTYPKRLIEVDLPIRRISAHARREKSIRHGHICTLHIWWARRPLAACRAVICAALWPDPADELCPQKFRDDAWRILSELRAAVLEGKISDERRAARDPVSRIHMPTKPTDHLGLRQALLDFIAEFANWHLSTNRFFLNASRALTQSAHEALGGAPGTKPLVVDPFAGGGSIPLEALRVGADAFASDLNPVAVLLNKVVLEYIPKYGKRLAEEVRKWGKWIGKRAERELAPYYPADSDGAVPIAYLWARRVKCEGPGCGAELPLIRSLWLSRGEEPVALRLIPNPQAKRVEVSIEQGAKRSEVGRGTVSRGSATCPCCGFTTSVESVREQLKALHGGTDDARLLCVVVVRPGRSGRAFRLPTEADLSAVRAASRRLDVLCREHQGEMSLIPDEPVNPLPHSVNRLTIYGMNTWHEVFTPRQRLALAVLMQGIWAAGLRFECELPPELANAAQVCLGLTLDRVLDKSSSLCQYDPSTKLGGISHTFTRQALPMVWDYGEGDPKSSRSGGWGQCLDWLCRVLEREADASLDHGTASAASATQLPLPDDSAEALVTDPPYYDMISYADLSDFFYVWLKRSLGRVSWRDEAQLLTPKREEVIVEPTPVEGVGVKDEAFYLNGMSDALLEARRVVRPSGLAVVVFAHKSTAGWEALLQSMIASGWTVTGSWPIDTEMTNKVSGIGQARLMSSVHLACRPRENPDGTLQTDSIGDWRDVLAELPRRIHDWMPRLAEEGVVGADAIFACLGPALEVFSRHSRVEKASGEAVTLREYLEQVWAAVAKEALNMIFEGADATGFEEDARLTAMWLWTLSTGMNGNGEAEQGEAKKTKPGPFVLEYDAARKIAQGFGAVLEDLASVVEVKSDTARLLSVGERARHLFGRDDARVPSGRKRNGGKQKSLFAELDEIEQADEAGGLLSAPDAGTTTLDRVHQSMLLFASGRSEALRRFLVEDGAGRDPRFWRLAQALSALYPTATDEKRWVDGVLARKKTLGF